jgi:alpha-L-fucosidase
MTSLNEKRAALRNHELAGATLGPFTPDWESLQQKSTPAWLSDAKFGVFIHWVVASVPAFGSEWYPRNMYIAGTPEYDHHIKTYGDQSDFGHKDFIPLFSGEKFDATYWVDLIIRAGAKYVVPVAEHHDGFALYDSDLTRWKSTEMGPRRDVIGELARASCDRGLAFGISYHRAENWWFFNGGTRFESDVHHDSSADLYGRAQSLESQPDETFLVEWSARLTEIIEKYDPALVWLDWWVEQPAFSPYLREFAAYYYNRGLANGCEPTIIYKWDAFAEGAATAAVERGSVRSIQTRFFQNDTSTSRVGWAHLSDNDFKSASDLVGELIDTVSKNGSLLLNIGPKPDGTITESETALLLGVGDWLAVNGEAIYSTRPWVTFGEGPTQQALGSFSDAVPTVWTAEDVRFTTSGRTVYACFFTWPESTALLRTFSTDLRLIDGKVKAVSLLGFGPIDWAVDESGLRITMPSERPNPISPVVAIEIELNGAVERYEPEFPE